MIKIAIDGPSGAGKGALAKALSAKLGYVYVDTGALYRAIGLHFHRCGSDGSDVARIASEVAGVEVDIAYENGEQQVYLKGENVSSQIRLPEISMMASAVSKIPEVRAHLLELQRGMAERHNVIMDGRDIGTVILPDANVKIFLTASPEARAERRYKELIEKGIDTSYEEVLADMKQRDENDRSRDIAPAIPAEDAVTLDNSKLDIPGTIQAALAIIREKVCEV